MKLQVETGPQFDIKQLYQNLHSNGSLSSKVNKMNELLSSKNRSSSNRSAKDTMLKVTPRSDTNILTKEYLRLQIREKEQQLSIRPQIKKGQLINKGLLGQQNLSSTELSNAVQKYHQYMQLSSSKIRIKGQEPDKKNNPQFESKILASQLKFTGVNALQTSKSQNSLLNQFVTKVNQDDMNRFNVNQGFKKRSLGVNTQDAQKVLTLSKPPTPTTTTPIQKPSTSNINPDYKFFSSSRPVTSDKNLPPQRQQIQQQSLTQSSIQNSKSQSSFMQKQSDQNLLKKNNSPISQSAIMVKASTSTQKWWKKEISDKSNQFEPLQNIQGYYLNSMQNAFKKPLSEDYFIRLYRDHFYQTYQGVYFAQFLKPADPNDLKNKRIFLKKADIHKNKITVVFDLDETLVHCNENTSIQSDITLLIQVSKNESINAGINIRPGAQELLKTLSQHFEIIVFTASHSCYAKKVLDYLDPLNNLIKHRLFRESCSMTTGGMYTKDLRIFADRSLDQLVLIDNAAYSYAWQVDNGIPIIPYYENKADRELEALGDYLKGMIGAKDVREYNRQHLRLQQFNESFGPQKAFEQIFGYPMEQ